MRFTTTTTRLTLLAASAHGAIWTPQQGEKWQIYLQGPYPGTSFPNVPVIDLDLFATTTTNISTLHNNGTKVICYFSAGTYENWRTDWNATSNQIGKALPDWPGEWWADIRLSSVRDVMQNRISLASSKGCDAVDPDNVDGYANDNGLGLTLNDSVNYIAFLADQAHQRGMAVGLKNALTTLNTSTSVVDFAVNEQCNEYDECSDYSGFVAAGKNVFQIEYPKGDKDNNNDAVSSSAKDKICQDPNVQKGFSTIMKNMDLDAWGEYCDGTFVTTSDSQAAQTNGSSNSQANVGVRIGSGALASPIVLSLVLAGLLLLLLV